MAVRPMVLLVLGDPAFAAAMQKYLAGNGFDTTLLRTGAEALEKRSTLKPAVVVVSQLLSGMDGQTLTERLKEQKPDLPVALVAAVSSPQGIGDVRKHSRADVVLPSTFQPDALLATLRRLTATPEEAARELLRKTHHKEIEERLKNAPKVEAPAQPVDPAPERIARSSVPVAALEPAWLFSRAYADGVTGALRFVSGGIERTVFFTQGRPVVVTSNVPEERIGQILIRKGKITPRELETALNQVKKKGKRLAQIIVELGVMTQREQEEEVADQYAERVLALFAWREASMEFESRPPPAELVPMRLAPERLLIEGLRRHYDIARLELVFPNPLAPLRFGPDSAARVALLSLSPLEGSVLVLVDGQRSVAELAALAPSRVDALRALYALACLGVVG